MTLAPGLTVANQYFGAVTSESSNFYGNPAAGILGLAFSSIASTRKPTIIEGLMAAGRLTANLFAVYQTRGQVYGSEISIGAINYSKFTGGITYTPVTSKTYWEVACNAPWVSGKQVTAAGNYPAAIDTGTFSLFPCFVAANLRR